MGSVTDLLNKGDFQDAGSQASNLMNGNQDIQDAITACQNAQAVLAHLVKNAVKIADGN
jgi:hypothetical protein